jgi:hypothetical protein
MPIVLAFFAIGIYMACVRIYDWWNGYGDLF